MKSLDKGLIEGNEKTESSFSDYKSVYRRSVNELKAGALGLCVLFAGGCAGALDDVITPQRVIGGGIQYRARTDINPNWGYNERVGADLIGGMIADSGNNRGHGESVGGSPIPSRNLKEPIFFNAAKETQYGFEDKRDIFYPGEEIHVVAEIPYGGKITNFGLALDKGEQIPSDLVNGAPGVEIVFKGYVKGENISSGVFDASKDLEKYGNHHRIYWMVNDKIIGFKDYAIMDKRPEQYSLK
jgi:hypothetical protein